MISCLRRYLAPYYERIRASAIFFLADLIGIHRYKKLEISLVHNVRLSLQVVKKVRNLVGPSKRNTLALFDNAPLLATVSGQWALADNIVRSN